MRQWPVLAGVGRLVLRDLPSRCIIKADFSMTWDDLPKVNRKREDHLLRPFGRLFGKRP